MVQLVLASSSKYRQQQLASLGIHTEAIAPHIDERAIPGEKPDALAARLATEKASKISEAHPSAMVIGSDQVAVVNDGGITHVLGKPGTHDNALKQLQLCSGKTVDFYSAVSLCHKDSNKQVTRVEITTVSFLTLSEKEIQQYLLAETPYDCAGSFKSEGRGVLLFDNIRSRDPNALIGLPLMLLRDLLREFGVNLLEIACRDSQRV
ncbi:Maf family protein [Alteromonas sp. H39]|uniref:Maf family protein n=1 Tax=Alteromonas sp. H39 TaxID=3389876 RepID=UPI0039DF936D